MFVQGVAGQEQAQQLLFKPQELGTSELLLPHRQLGHQLFCPEERLLAGDPLPFGQLGEAEPLVHQGQQPFAGLAEPVEGPCPDEVLHRVPGHPFRVHPLTEVEESLEGPLPAGLQDRLHRRAPHVLDRRQAKSDLPPSQGGEIHVRFIYVRGQHLDAHLPTLGDVGGHFVRVVPHRGEERGHELRGVVGLEVSSPIGDEGVGGGVGFVEAITGELLDVGEDPPGFLFRDSVVHTAGDEPGLHLRHHFRLLLAHGLAQEICLGQGEPGQPLGHEHHLILIDGQAIGFLEHFLQGRVGIGDRLPTVLALDVVLGHAGFQRPWPVQGQDGDEFPELGRLQAPDQGPHPGGLQLEHPAGLPLPDQLEGGLVVERDLGEVHPHPGPLLHQPAHVIEQGQVPEPQEVHLQEAQGLQVVHVELGNELAV